MANHILPAGDSHGKTLFAAFIMGILCTLCIYMYSTNNLDLLGLSPESKQARTLEIIVLLLGQTFLAFAIGKIYRHNLAWAYKLGFILLILFVVDFASSYQSRNAINQHQTLAKSATQEHAKLITAQIGVSQSAATELTDSAKRQRDNKLITGSAATAQKAAKQSDSAVELIKLHGETIKQIKPTEADTFGAWTGTIIFFSILGLYLLNDAMWAFIGSFMGGQPSDSVSQQTTTRAPAPLPAPAPIEEPIEPTPQPSDSVSPTPAQPSDSVSLEKAKDAMKRSSMPWKVSPFVIAAPLAAVAPMATAAQAPEPPTAPSDSVTPTPAHPSDSVTPEAPEPAAKPKKARAKKLEVVETIQYDTATTGAASHRYQRIRQMVKDKKVKPYVTHIAAIKNEALNTYRAKKYLQAMVNDGLLYWDADKERFRLIETDPRQIELGGL